MHRQSKMSRRTNAKSAAFILSVCVIKVTTSAPRGEVEIRSIPALKGLTTGSADVFIIVKIFRAMQTAILEGVQNPVEEITSKLSNYFRTRGFKQEGQFDKFGCDGDFAFEVSGTIDDIQVQVCYQDYKPRKLVVRELLALDERISNVDAYRFLSNENYREELGRIELEPIFVMIDGKLMQTTIYEYVQYGARNKDYTRS